MIHNQQEKHHFVWVFDGKFLVEFQSCINNEQFMILFYLTRDFLYRICRPEELKH